MFLTQNFDPGQYLSFRSSEKPGNFQFYIILGVGGSYVNFQFVIKHLSNTVDAMPCNAMMKLESPNQLQNTAKWSQTEQNKGKYP